MEAYIIGGVRTPVGSFGGALQSVDAIELGSIVIKEILARTNANPADVNEVILGNVIQAGLGQNVSRQATLKSGLPIEVPAFTVNKVCGSGLKTVALAAQAVASGSSEMIIAGGTEHMSGAPYLLRSARWGQRMGNGEMVDSMICDALWDKQYDCHMGITAENIAEKHNITRQDQDEFAAHSQQKAEQSIKDGKFKDEIVAVRIKQRKGDDKVFDTDEYPKAGTTLATLSKLRPAFKKDGTVTAGNASGINDGAGVVMVVSKAKMEALKPKWAFKVVSTHSAAIDPSVMGLGPIEASKGAIAKAKCNINDIDLLEINEAFASQSIAVHREMKWDLARVNVLGGAIAIGHPVGASGTRILITLLHEMVRSSKNLGLASLCIGGGQGIAVIVERVK
ncbi:MAG: acetyl-CoA C-acetyltransferase [Nitrospirae bacterium]|nr:acetyl-CoA C-acetyltransferase [Nitrospirota bacterium]